jgi:hypothetical protein
MSITDVGRLPLPLPPTFSDRFIAIRMCRRLAQLDRFVAIRMAWRLPQLGRCGPRHQRTTPPIERVLGESFATTELANRETAIPPKSHGRFPKRLCLRPFRFIGIMHDMAPWIFCLPQPKPATIPHPLIHFTLACRKDTTFFHYFPTAGIRSDRLRLAFRQIPPTCSAGRLRIFKEQSSLSQRDLSQRPVIRFYRDLNMLIVWGSVAHRVGCQDPLGWHSWEATFDNCRFYRFSTPPTLPLWVVLLPCMSVVKCRWARTASTGQDTKNPIA